MKKYKKSTNERDKNSDTGITLKKINSTIGVPDNEPVSEKIDLTSEITSKISSSISVAEDEHHENITHFTPLKSRTARRKITVTEDDVNDSKEDKIDFNEVKAPGIKLFDFKSLHKGEQIKEPEPVIEIKKIKLDDVDENKLASPPLEKPIPKELESEKIVSKVKKNYPEEKPIIPVTAVPKDIFDELDKPIISPSLDKPEPKLLREEPDLTSVEEPMIVPQELPVIVPQELPVVIPQELPEVIPQELPIVIPQELPIVIPQELPIVIPQELPSEIYDFKPDELHELPMSIPLDKLPETLEKQFHERQQRNLQESIQKEIEETLNKRYTKADLEDVTVVVEDKKNIDKINKQIHKKPKMKIIVVEDINELLSELDRRTKTLISDDAMLELYSFTGELPKVSKISYKTYNVQNLYSKIDDLSKLAKAKLIATQEEKEKSLDKKQILSSRKKLEQELNTDAIIEELTIPEIIPIKDNIADIDSLVNNKFSESMELRQEDMHIPTFVDTKSGPELNKKVEDNLQRLNENKLKKEKDYKKQDPSKKQNINIFVESKKEASPEQVPSKPDPRISVLEKELEEEKAKLNIFMNQERNRPTEVKVVDLQTQLPKIEPKAESEVYLNKDVAPSPKDKRMSYILPKDARADSFKNAGFVGQEGVYSTPRAFNFEKDKIQSLVYSIPMNVIDLDVTKVFEKYALDEFTYVTISYVKDKGLFYNMVQLDLTPEQNKVFYEIKKIFFNSIDQNYYTFSGDKYTLEQYTKKIFDIAISKLAYQVNSLDKKLFYKFIQREFSGLGILTALLSDKKVLEVSCAGEKTSVIVYHLDYGTLETNINFDNINKLNQFVLLLTKNMGMYVNSAHPIIEGYLPNGYKVEGLFSAGDLSSKGSSFVIKKYLEAPLTPVTLIKSGVGTIDVFAYIWSAISEDYKVILTGDDTSFIFLNSVGLLYPDKKIISIQSYDRIKLPQKQWIKRVVTGSEDIDKKTIIQHTISERPDYIFVDEFGSDIFDIPWYSINLCYVNYSQIPQLRENMKNMGQKAIIIELKKLKLGFNETTQIVKIEEIVDRNDFITVELSTKDRAYHLNLLSSTIDIVNFNKRKKYMRWLSDTNIADYRDFNSIITEFLIDEDKVVKRLGIDLLA